MQNLNFTQGMFSRRQTIPESAKIIFVADVFADEYVGGAELTTQVLIESSPLEVHRIKSRDVNLQTLEMAADRFWIFGNFAMLNPNLIPTIAANLRYGVLEYDYKYCRFRSPEKHFVNEGVPCDCHNQMNGKLISAFYYAAQCIWWMSEKQKDRYLTLFPFLGERNNIVLSSVFDDKTLSWIKKCGATVKPEDRKGWIALSSPSWIKGSGAAETWCMEHADGNYEMLGDLPYEHVLARMAVAEGFVYLPLGGDTCPRMVIEAKLLGCKLQINDNVQHRYEEWFDTDDVESIYQYLYANKRLFWQTVLNCTQHNVRISGYTTTRDCIKQAYPWESSITSMLGFCDEVVVVDGGSTDGTWEKLLEWSKTEPKLKSVQNVRDWESKRFAVFDGEQKAYARSLCTGDFCWQSDVDEIVDQRMCGAIKDMAAKTPRAIELIALPIVEYWGRSGKVRVDVNPWKWRLSRNTKRITHGIPGDQRRYDADGTMYSAGSDGCDYIYADTLERVPFMTFYTPEVDALRQRALANDPTSLKSYEDFINKVRSKLPTVYHHSWVDIERKIKTYRNYWSKHWQSLFNVTQEDTIENNMFFDKPWSQVTDEEISARAKELEEKLGGWIWHRKWDGTITPFIRLKDTHAC